jgi:AcrR family transcriptional regulator
MKELGLTKGGFYRHFESKCELYAAAVARAFDEFWATGWWPPRRIRHLI